MKKISIVTPVFNEEENLPDYFETVEKVLFAGANYEFEVLLIDDGSRDRSWEIIHAQSLKDPRFKGIKLSHNHGSHHALAAGFSFAKGDAVATLACDLQDPPETINDFINGWEEGFDIVWGVRKKRDDSWHRIMASKFFERLIRKWAAPPGSKFATGSFFVASMSCCGKRLWKRWKPTE